MNPRDQDIMIARKRILFHQEPSLLDTPRVPQHEKVKVILCNVVILYTILRHHVEYWLTIWCWIRLWQDEMKVGIQ